jgi:hypothetical protein
VGEDRIGARGLWCSDYRKCHDGRDGEAVTQVQHSSPNCRMRAALEQQGLANR